MWIGLPNLRKSHQPQKLILDVNGLPSLRVRLRCDPIDKWERAHPAAAALIHTLLQEHRVETRLSRKVGKKSKHPLPGPSQGLRRMPARQEAARRTRMLLRLKLNRRS